ncbi:hypothetical protein, partial [Curtobacterium sp. C2H10]|uniref:hypothetical protein n=1 Tax=Curtobacterium sp. C2H10 TaxID=2736664 RepID=UPI0021C1E252
RQPVVRTLRRLAGDGPVVVVASHRPALVAAPHVRVDVRPDGAVAITRVDGRPGGAVAVTRADGVRA